MKYKIFAKSKDGVYVDYIYSTFFESYEQGDIFIKEGLTIEFIHHGMNVYDSNMCHNYKIENGKVVETTQEDKLLELSSRYQEPTEIEAIQNKISILTEQNNQQEEIIASLTYELMMLKEPIALANLNTSNHSPKYSLIKSWFNKGYWNEDMLLNAVERHYITEEEMNEIIG